MALEGGHDLQDVRSDRRRRKHTHTRVDHSVHQVHHRVVLRLRRHVRLHTGKQAVNTKQRRHEPSSQPEATRFDAALRPTGKRALPVY